MNKLLCLSLILLTSFSSANESVKLYIDKKDSNNIKKSIEQLKLNLDNQNIDSEIIINEDYSKNQIDALELGLVNLITPTVTDVNNK
jgi:hypothetical protein